ncbi:MAG: hypothetical protein U0X20_22010 [Caldilineaceae bacterium]
MFTAKLVPSCSPAGVAASPIHTRDLLQHLHRRAAAVAGGICSVTIAVTISGFTY